MKLKKIALLNLLMAVATVPALTSCDDDEPKGGEIVPPGEEEVTPPEEEEETTLKQSDIVGAWDAEGYRWDLDEGRSICYEMTEDGTDFAFDDEGNYITIPSIREYCEQYARDYNADEANTVKGTPEDFANHNYEGTYMFTNINVTEDHITIYGGQDLGEAGRMSILCVDGKYTFDEETATLTVEDVAIVDDPRTLKVNVFKDEDGLMNFRYADYDMYTTPNYAGTKTYYVYAPMIFYCKPGKPYIPNN